MKPSDPHDTTLKALSARQEVRSEQFLAQDNLPVYRHSTERTTHVLELESR